MTIGQSIAALRKQQQRSQEDLGAELGISRQSISKWESDTSLPEIDKLIALSKLFGVSVGYLLGVENAPEAKEKNTDSGELNESQLKMVEEIVNRYISAQNVPAPQPKKTQQLLCIAAIAIIFAFLVTTVTLNGRLNQLNLRYNELQSSISNMQWRVDSSISGISSRVEEILKSQNQLTATYSAEQTDRDVAANTATFSVRAVPKTYTPGMQAVFCATQGTDSSSMEVPGILGENQEFSATLTCPLSDEITLSVTFITGDKRETQQLDVFCSLFSETIPEIDVQDYDLMYLEPKYGKLQLLNTYFSYENVVDVERAQAKIASVRMGLFKNRELVSWAVPCDKPANYQGFDNHHFYRLPNIEVPFAENDVLAVVAFVTDEYGREFAFTGISVYELDEKNKYLIWYSGEDYSYGCEEISAWKF